MTGRALVAGGLILAGMLLHHVAAAQQTFGTRLDTVPIDFGTLATTTGYGVLSATLAGSELTVQGSFERLSGPATEAWLHVGTVVGARGPAEYPLTVSQAAAGEVSGVVRLSRQHLDALRAGRLYVQIHSQAAPEGNLWGWLMPEDDEQ